MTSSPASPIDLRSGVAAAASRAGFEPDEAQLAVIDAVSELLAARKGDEDPGNVDGAFGLDGAPVPDGDPEGASADDTVRPPLDPRHLYVWGPVGRGKTWLLDAIVAELPADTTRRVHFHEFFRELHLRIHRARTEHEGRLDRDSPDPFEAIVDDMLGGATVLYFDEFHVHDSGDATLLIRLLAVLFTRDVVLIFSSNYPPAELLPDEMYHHLFLPGIAAIEGSMRVLGLDGGSDYRRLAPAATRTGFARGSWISPGTDEQLAKEGLRRPREDEATDLVAGPRTFTAASITEGTLWLDFSTVLEAHTSVSDYLEWVSLYDRWVLSGVPKLRKAAQTSRQRFVTLIDVLCEAGVELHVIAAVPLADFGTGGDLPVDLDRTTSRLALLRSGPEETV